MLFLYPIVMSNTSSILQILTGHKNEHKSHFEACFTPDSKHVLCGSDNASLHLWRVADGKHEATLKGHTGPVLRVLCSPKFQVVASADTSTALWVKPPTEEATNAQPEQ